MACFQVEPKKLGTLNGDMQFCLQKLNAEKQHLDRIKITAYVGANSIEIRAKLGVLKGQLHQESADLNTLLLHLAQIKQAYETAENNILGLNAATDEITEQEGDTDSFLENAIQQALFGEFYDGETNWLGEVLSFIVSCIPGLNCLADLRDLAADIIIVFEDGKVEFNEVILLGLDVVDLVGDAISFSTIMKSVKKATTLSKLADTAAKEYAETAAEDVTKKAAKKAAKDTAEKAADEAYKTAKKKVVTEVIENTGINDSPEEMLLDYAADEFKDSTRDSSKKSN